MKKNPLNIILTEQLKTKPYFIGDMMWVYTRSILLEIRDLFVDKILNKEQIRLMELSINKQLNQIAELTDALQLYEIHCYITESMDYYLFESVEGEYYEMSANLSYLQKLLCVKIAII